MSPTLANVLASGGAPSSGSNVTASWTPDTAKQYLLAVNTYVSTGSVAPAISSVSGNGLTWTFIDSIESDNTGADRSKLFLYAASGSGGSVGAITISWSVVPTRASWSLDAVTGAASGLGTGSLPQADVAASSSNANPSATLGSALQSGSVSYAAAGFESSAGTLSAGSGYTQLGAVANQSLSWLITEWNSSGSTSASASNTTTSNRHGIIVVEIATGVTSVTGTAAVTLKKMTASGTGQIKVTGTASVTLKKMTASGTGRIKVTGTASVTLKKLIASGTGQIKVTGTADVTLKKLTASGTGLARVIGTADVTLKKMIASATGEISVTGTADVTLNKMTASGSGTIAITGGVGDVTLNKLTVLGSGTITVAGSGDVVLKKLIVRGFPGSTSTVSSLFIFSSL